jgi:hypothetical protein
MWETSPAWDGVHILSKTKVTKSKTKSKKVLKKVTKSKKSHGSQTNIN